MTTKNLRVIVGALALAPIAIRPMPAAAQLSRVGDTVETYVPGGVMRGTDIAWDPVNDVYLEVVGNGPVYGVFVDAAGMAVSPGFTIHAPDGSTPGTSSTWAHFPRVTYGNGGFLVTWHHGITNVNHVWGRVVSYATPGFLASGPQLISDAAEGGSWHETAPAIAYSQTSSRFLVAWRTVQYGLRGRFVGTKGVPQGGIIELETSGGSRHPALTWNPATNDFGLAYTGFDDSAAFTSFRRINAATGDVSGSTTFGFGPRTSTAAIDLNSANEYVLVWTVLPGTKSARLDQSGTLLTSTYGLLVSSQFDAPSLAYNPNTQTFLAVAPDGGIVGREMDSAGAPLPATSTQISRLTLGLSHETSSFDPRTTARANTNQWAVVFSADYRGATTQIVASGSSGADTGREAPVVSVPDINGANVRTVPLTITGLPGATVSYLVGDRLGGGGTLDSTGTFRTFLDLSSLGDGVIHTAAILRGSGGDSEPGFDSSMKDTVPPARPTVTLDLIDASNHAVVNFWIAGTTSVSCSYTVTDGNLTLSGVAALNRSGFFATTLNLTTLANGIVTASAVCADAIGNGGPTSTITLQKNVVGTPVAPPPLEPIPVAPAPVQTCSTPDPFVALGGGTCCNGGWLPPGLTCSTPATQAPPSTPTSPSTPSATCSTPDPFVALGGGTCCNGGWLPPGLSCITATTPAPPSIPTPPSTGCTGPDPFASIPGMYGECLNGGWVPRIR